MAALSTPLKLTSAFAVVTGLMNLIAGVGWLETITGVPLPVENRAAVFADSQLRFFGAIWAGYGAMLWWASNDVRGRRVPLTIMACTMALSGIGRTISGFQHGFSSAFTATFPAIELLAPSALWFLG